MLNLMSIQIQDHGTPNLRRGPPPENMNQSDSASQIREATQIQQPGIVVIGADVLGGSMDGDIHGFGAFGLGSAGAGSGLADDGTGVDETDRGVVEIEGAEVGIVDGELGGEGEVKGGRRGIGVGEGEFGDGERGEVESRGIDAEDDESED